MCQAIAEGGRRCPVHQHNTIAVLQVAREGSGLNQRQLEALFRELRREGRDAELPEDLWAQTAVKIRALAADVGVTDEVTRQLALGETQVTDPATLYAQAKLFERANQRGERLRAEFARIASIIGLEPEELAVDFETRYATIGTGRDAALPASYNETARRDAFHAGLPSDPASVVALAGLRELLDNRVIDEDMRIPGWSFYGSERHGYVAWDNGRLEIRGAGSIYDEDRPRAAYRNVSRETYQQLEQLYENRFQDGTAIRQILDTFHANPTRHMYHNEAEQDFDRRRYRCLGCGQFRNLDHTCPRHERWQALIATGMPVGEVQAILHQEDLVSGRLYEVSSERLPDLLGYPRYRDGAGLTVTRVGVDGYGSRETLWRDHIEPYAMVPENLRVTDENNPSFEDLDRLMRERALFEAMANHTLPNIGRAQMRELLAAGDVSLGLVTRFDGYPADTWRAYSDDWHGMHAQVTGELRYAQLSETEVADLNVTPALRHATLACTCERYRRDHTCEHVAIVAANAGTFYANRAAAMRPTETFESYVARFQEEIQFENDITHDFYNRRQFDSDLTREQVEQRYLRLVGVESREAHIANRRAEQLRREQEAATARQRAREAAERAQRAEREAAAHVSAYRDEMLDRWKDTGYTYAEDKDAFYRDYKATISRRRANETAVPYRLENVTDGICADVPGARRFGIELEFDLDQNVTDRAGALRAIGAELHAAGLTPSPNQTGYHTGRRGGWDSWSFEADSTVDAELVSPIMSDTPEHWGQLQTALEIIKRHGGKASTRTGSHIHVSTGSYENSTAKHAELLRVVDDNQDILYRLASNPKTGKHRGMQWCAPNIRQFDDDVPASRSSYKDDFYQHNSHAVALNFESTFADGFTKSNVEFRMWDGTLDPGVIQQQVAISAAITDYAERKVLTEQKSSRVRGTRWELGEAQEWEKDVLTAAERKSHDRETFANAHGHVAEFFDKLFRRPEDHAAATALFAVTKWQEDPNKPRVIQQPVIQQSVNFNVNYSTGFTYTIPTSGVWR